MSYGGELGMSMPGDPAGMPGAAMPAWLGRSVNRRCTWSAGTCPSRTTPLTTAVWQERAFCGT